MACKQSAVLRVLLNIFLVVLVFLVVIISELDFGVKPFKQGFFCNDASLSKPYRDSTVSIVAVICIGVGINLVVIAVFERIAVRNARARQSEQYSNQDVCLLLSQEMVLFYEVFLVFLFGTAIQQATANITKFMTGRLRPHFFDVCRPNYTAFSCVDARGHPKFILEDVCTVPDSYKALDMRLSFPSGHASLATYCMVFFVTYLQVRWATQRHRLTKTFVQVIALWLAVCVCLSRVSDYKHHWGDVLAGAVLGAIVAVFMVKCVLGPSKRPTKREDTENSGSSSGLTEW